MKSIDLYNNVVRDICEEFANKYFEGSDRHIIGNMNIGLGPLEVADYFFSIDEIACALNNNIPRDVLLEWYDDLLGGRVKSNLYNYYLQNK